ncbi:unnamed protein product, partial [Prorocentrum cordatum]
PHTARRAAPPRSAPRGPRARSVAAGRWPRPPPEVPRAAGGGGGGPALPPRPDKFYNHRAGPASACCTGRGVVLQVAKRLEFWLFLLVHIGVSVAWRMGFLQ